MVPIVRAAAIGRTVEAAVAALNDTPLQVAAVVVVVERMERRQRARRVQLEDGSVPSLAAGIGRAVEAAVAALDEPRVRIPAVSGVVEPVQRREIARRVDFEDRSISVRAAVDGRAVETVVAPAPLDECRVGIRTVVGVVKRVQRGERARRVDLEDGPVVSRAVGGRRAVEAAVSALDKPSVGVAAVVVREAVQNLEPVWHSRDSDHIDRDVQSQCEVVRRIRRREQRREHLSVTDREHGASRRRCT